jgi:hypothetical protein
MQINWQLPSDWNLYEPWFSRGVPVAKHPMSDMAAAASVVVGVGIDTMEDEKEDEEVAAEAMVRSDVAAVRAEMNLMENMVAE